LTFKNKFLYCIEWKAPEWSDTNVITAILKYPSEQYNKPSWVGLATKEVDNIISRRFDSSSFQPIIRKNYRGYR
jgi:retron-type reverse transcriptase